MKILSYDILKKMMLTFGITLLLTLFTHLGIYLIPWEVAKFVYTDIDSSRLYIEFAPEIFLTLLSIELGTLILVISIASQRNPKLIDYYLGDFPSLFYMSLITIAGVENMFLQLELSANSLFINNIIMINSFLILPLLVVFAAPYAFYILSYTKTSSLVATIAKESFRMMNNAMKPGRSQKYYFKTQLNLVETINQLDDQQSSDQFKEFKGLIIKTIDSILSYYIENKGNFQDPFFKISPSVRSDTSLRTFRSKFDEIEVKKTFFEHKVSKILSDIYNQLIEANHHDLAAQTCGVLSNLGKGSIVIRDNYTLNLVLIQYNTFLRFSIKKAQHSGDVRNVYNCVDHYTHLTLYIIRNADQDIIKNTCDYLIYYAKVSFTISLKNPTFIFLVDAFLFEIQKVIKEMYRLDFDMEIQMRVLESYVKIDELPEDHDQQRAIDSTSRIVHIGLILFFMKKEEQLIVRLLIRSLINNLKKLAPEQVRKIIIKDCESLYDASPTFWEYTDIGNQNIYYSSEKDQIERFQEETLSLYAKKTARRKIKS